MKPGPRLTAAVLILLTLIWGSTWAVIRVGLVGIPPLTGVALRFGIASILLFSIGIARRVPFGAGRHEKALWWSTTLLSFCASYVVVYWGEQYVPSGLAAVLWATFPLILAVMAHFLIPGERIRPITIIGTLVGFAGVGVIYSEDFALLGGPKVLFASIVFLLSPLVSAIANVLVKRWGKDVHPISLTAVGMGMTFGIIGALALILERDRPPVFNGTSLAALFYLAVFGSAVTFSLYYWLLQHLPATRLSMISYGTPIVAVLIGSTIMNEPLTPRVLLGALMVLAGVGLTVVNYRGRRVAAPVAMERGR